jgi:hypothetical protein
MMLEKIKGAVSKRVRINLKYGPRQGNFDVTVEDSVEFVHENLKVALPESRVSGEIAHHMSVTAH